MNNFHTYAKTAVEEQIGMLDDLLTQGEQALESSSASSRRPTKKPRPGSEELNEGDEEVSNYMLLMAMQRLENMHVESLQRLKRMEEAVNSNAATIKELKTSVEFQGEQIEEVTGKVNTFETELKALKKENAALKEKCRQIENHSRRQNLRVSGIPERPGESVKKIVVELFSQISPSIAAQLPFSVDVAHRLGPPRVGEGALPRRIIVRFLSRDHRDQVWRDSQTSTVLRQRKFFLTQDLTQETKEARNKLWPLVEKARKERKRAGFRGACAYIEGKRITVDDIEK